MVTVAKASVMARNGLVYNKCISSRPLAEREEEGKLLDGGAVSGRLGQGKVGKGIGGAMRCQKNG